MKDTHSPWGDDPEEQGGWILSFLDFYFAGDDVDGLAHFIVHTGLTTEDIKAAGGDLEQAVLNHYRCGCGRGYDIRQLEKDFDTYPPIARRIAEIKYEHEVKRGARGRTQKPN